MAQPLEEGIDALAEQRRVVAGVRVADFFVAGLQVEDQCGEAGILQTPGEVGFAGIPVVADGILGDEDQACGVRRVGLQRFQPDGAGGDAEGGLAQFHHDGDDGSPVALRQGNVSLR